jgi:hypothetical protein
VSDPGSPPPALRPSGAPHFAHLRDPGDLAELRESMREFGWIKQLPAIADEHGTLIVGHRRMRVALELGIEPRVVRITFGDDDGAEGRRVRLAIASNLGSKPFTAAERRRIASALYATGSWTLTAIADVLGCCATTVSADLADVPRIRRNGNRLTPEASHRIVALAAGGVSRRTIASEMGVDVTTVNRVVKRHRDSGVEALAARPLAELDAALGAFDSGVEQLRAAVAEPEAIRSDVERLAAGLEERAAALRALCEPRVLAAA